MEKLSKAAYEKQITSTRDQRMRWWREARYGMFVHYGLYSLLARHEWAMAVENIPASEYRQLADSFRPKPGAAREWARLAKAAEMKYMVLTTRHHEGFSLWDSKVNPFNSVNYGPKRDLVAEFVEACREQGLRIGFYSTLMDWHHPDSWTCANDREARIRFTDYIRELNRELMTQYGKIDILWYDVPLPLESWEGWNSLELNQLVRELQPDIIINNRSRLDEDFGTPEGHITADKRDWEACMTFNDLSWGYLDSAQAAPYSYNAQRIIRMLHKVTKGGGNLLLNIGPAPDGSVPSEAIEPLTQVGQWLEDHGTAVYGKVDQSWVWRPSGICDVSAQGNKLYLWNWIWPAGGTLTIGGLMTPVKAVRLLRDGSPVDFEQQGHRLFLKNLPETTPDPSAGIAVFELEFTEPPQYRRASAYPQLHGGEFVDTQNLATTEGDTEGGAPKDVEQ